MHVVSLMTGRSGGPLTSGLCSLCGVGLPIGMLTLSVAFSSFVHYVQVVPVHGHMRAKP
jgi:hypothetical protein